MQRITYLGAVTLFVLLFSVFSSFSQPLLQMNGRVVNAKNEPVGGASIQAQGKSRVVAADVEGRFVLNLEPGKKYTLTVSAIGFTTKEVAEVEVVSGAENNYTFVLDVAAKEVGEIIIRSTAKKENTAGLLNFQRNNTSLSSGLSADFIRRTPDKNTGEILKRVSGASIQDNKFVVVRGLSDRYNQAMINGAQLPSSEPDKKAFSFDVIPSQLIDNIIINKTATPDVTGEFAGGLVQITTKDIPGSSSLNLGFGLGFNTQSVFKTFTNNPRGSNDWIGFDNQRNLPSAYPQKYNDFLKLSLAEQTAITNSFRDDVWREQQTTAGPIQSYNLTWSNVIRGKKGGAFGSVLGITYRNARLIFNATKELFEKDGQQAFFDYNDQQNRYSTNVGAIANIAWSKKKSKIAFKNLFNQLLEDNYYTRSGINTENLQDVMMRSSVLNQRSLFSSQVEGTHKLGGHLNASWNVNYSMNHKQQPDLRVLTYGRPIGTASPFQVNLRGNNTNRFFSNLKDQAVGYNASLSYNFMLGAQKQTVKIGGSSTVRFRDFKAFIFGFNDPADLTLLELPYDQILSKSNFKSGGFQLTTALQNPQDQYFGISALNAGYVMFDNKLTEKWRIVWGTRIEHFEQFLKSNQQGTEKAVVINSEKLDFLPSLNVTYSPTSKINIRVAGSRTVARPEFREIAPFAFFDFETIASTAGQPGLQRSSILNGDLRFEWYPKAGEVLSAGIFYKKFTNPIELRLNSGSVATRRQYEFQNAASATLYGTEFEFRRNLSFITQAQGWLERLYFTGNVSLILSEVLLSNTDASGNQLAPTKRPLQGQSPYLVNAGFQYDSKSGTGFSLFYNRVGERLTLVGNADFGDIYELPRNLIDFQVSQKVMKGNGEVRLNISDVLNQVVATYENRNTSKAYQKDVDRTFSSFRPGTTFTIAFSYNFNLKGK